MHGPWPDSRGPSAARIERWLLDSPVQLHEGPHAGGIAGWLDPLGRPKFVYLEITGYYLTAMAWLAGGAASSDRTATEALARGRRALDWVTSTTAGGAVPQTRLHLRGDGDDWRNAAIFCFDLAMAARGVACFAAAAGIDEADTPLGEIGARVEEVCAGAPQLRSHVLRDEAGQPLPDRWSTRPGPHHVKAAAALLRLPPETLDPAVGDACRATIASWAEALEASWPSPQLHPVLYGIEGLLMLSPEAPAGALDAAECAFERLMELQRPDGMLPAAVDGQGTEVRADVIAQALRAGELLRQAGRLQDDGWRPRLNALAADVASGVREDGGVLFSTEHQVANAWCAMFALQALALSQAADGAGPPLDPGVGLI